MSDPDTSAEPTTLAATLLALQAIDTEADQLANRRAHSELRAAAEQRSAQLSAWDRRRAELIDEIARLEETVTTHEARGAELVAHRDRLDAQLRTVIAPREAEALMHEIATIDAERDEIDVVELAALERQSALDDDLVGHMGSQAMLRDALDAARLQLAAEEAEIDATLARLDGERAGIRSEVPDAVLATYDRKRAAFGVAVARLIGKQCQGCHLELSAAEIDTVRDEAAATGVTDCPDCGRLLVVS